MYLCFGCHLLGKDYLFTFRKTCSAHRPAATGCNAVSGYRILLGAFLALSPNMLVQSMKMTGPAPSSQERIRRIRECLLLRCWRLCLCERDFGARSGVWSLVLDCAPRLVLGSPSFERRASTMAISDWTNITYADSQFLSLS